MRAVQCTLSRPRKLCRQLRRRRPRIPSLKSSAEEDTHVKLLPTMIQSWEAKPTLASPVIGRNHKPLDKALV